VAGIVSSVSRSRRSLAASNEWLETKLAEREGLVRSQERRQAIAEERERIMRDMHDSIGSRLTILLAQMEGRKSSTTELAASVRDTLQDLRLLVDSIDTAGETLATSMGAFRARVQPVLSRSGIELSWSMDEGVKRTEVPASSILHIYLIAQEAISNAISHGSAKAIDLSLSRQEGVVTMHITDDGSGLCQDLSKGKGLRNMHERAAKMGGQVTIENRTEGSGVSVTLVVPVEGKCV